VNAIPRINAARNSSEHAAAAQDMLASLDDPVTRVVSVRTEPRTAPDPVRMASDSDDVLTVSIRDYRVLADYWIAQPQLRPVAGAVRKSKAVIFDLRPIGGFGIRRLADHLPWVGLDETLAVVSRTEPGQRKRVHRGFPDRARNRLFQSTLSISDGRRDSVSNPDRTGRPVVFEGKPADDPVVEVREIGLTGGLKARVRISELLYRDGTSGLAPNAVVEFGNPLAVARAIVRNSIPADTSAKLQNADS